MQEERDELTGWDDPYAREEYERHCRDWPNVPREAWRSSEWWRRPWRRLEEVTE